jgi:eukaryotic-like serine/threonine-protein kinase
MPAPPQAKDDAVDSTPTLAAAPATEAVPTPQVDPESITALTAAPVMPESVAPETLAARTRANLERAGTSPAIDSAPQTIVNGSPSSATLDRMPDPARLARVEPDAPEEETLARIDRASLDLPDDGPADDETLARITRPDLDGEGALATLARPSPVLDMGAHAKRAPLGKDTLAHGSGALAPAAGRAAKPAPAKPVTKLVKSGEALLVPPKLAPPRPGASAVPPKPLNAVPEPPTPAHDPLPKVGPADSVASIRVLPAAEMSATSIGKYRLLAAIGEGGMADVFLAVSSGLGDFEKLVVIKQLRETLAEDPTFVQMFLDEARLAARLNHPNVVQTHEVVSDGWRHFIAMEYLEGVPYVRLARRKDRVSAPLALHLRVLCDALYGLHYAHELKDFDGQPLNVVHRDVSPQNLMLTYNGGVKLLDFGIAKAAFAVDQRPDDFKGKLEYMAPEQARLEDVDRRADIFGIGVMLWEAVARRRMYVRGEDKYAKLVGGQLPDLKEVRPDAPSRLAKICARAIAHNPAERYATAQDMATDLEEYLESTTQHVTNRDLGSYVSEKFARSREKMLGAIDAQLKALRSGEAMGPPKALALSQFPEPFESEVPPPVGYSDLPPPPEPGAPPPMGYGFVPAPPPPFNSYPPGESAPALASGPALPSLPPQPYGAPSLPPLDAAPRTGPRPFVFAFVALAAVALLFVGGVVFMRARGHAPALAKRGGTSSAAASSPAPSAAGAPQAAKSATPSSVGASPPPVAAAAEIDYTIKVTPASARIFVDGKEQPTNPAMGRVPRDGQMHTIRIEADGYEPKQEQVTFDRSILLSMELHAVSKSSRSSGTRSQPRPSPPVAQPTAASQPATTSVPTPKRPKKKLDLDSDNPYGN